MNVVPIADPRSPPDTPDARRREPGARSLWSPWHDEEEEEEEREEAEAGAFDR
jgi:hypothetical protein